jgi:peptidoglycan/LPS O-acetylase OafA/YrhL
MIAPQERSKFNLSPGAYRTDIDGLRGLAVIAVIGFHAFPSAVPGGFVGVDVFFVISGYLISGIIFGNLNRGTFSFRNFYYRRIKRIFPALIVVLIGCFFLGRLVLLPEEFKTLGSDIVSGAAFISNFKYWHEAGYFDSVAGTKPLLHLWSLGIEEQFYIVWPLLLWAAKKRKLNFLVAICVGIASFVLNVVDVHHNPVAAFYSPASRFWELMLGAMLVFSSRPNPNQRLLRNIESIAGV